MTVSRRSRTRLRARGIDARSLRDVMAELSEPDDPWAEAERIERRYSLPTIRDVYRTDRPCAGQPEEWCLRRTIRHVRAMERLFDELEPEVVVPEVGSETVRTAAHLVALDRGIPTLFLFYTIFPDPLRLYVDTMHAPIVAPEELRALSPEERTDVERFRSRFTDRGEPIRAHRSTGLTRARVGQWLEHAGARLGEDRDEEYLRPGRWLAGHIGERARHVAARPLYARPAPDRRYVYFPLHVTDDYKIKRVIPHCVDQASIAEQIADALPAGYDLVLKEHPMSIGRNKLSLLRRLQSRENTRLVHPLTSSHSLIRGADAVAVISSTVGLEALLYEKPVLTLGQPFYAGLGVTVDLASFAEIRHGVPALLRYRPDPERITRFLHAAMRRCRPGAPVLVDRSPENARALAGTLDRVAREDLAARASARLVASRS